MYYLIIGDIAGQYNALMRLIEQVPPDTKIISVGDICDRGKKSRKVYEFFMDGYGETKFAVLGNHDHMMLSECCNLGYYEQGAWFRNGGNHTLANYRRRDQSLDLNALQKTLDFIKLLPIYMQFDIESKKGNKNIIVTHTPISTSFNDFKQDDTLNQIWNRAMPRDLSTDEVSTVQVFGHNSHWGLRFFQDPENPYAICIDQSAKKVLTGLLLPDFKVLTSKY